MDPSNGFKEQATTSDSGTYLFSSLAAGTYTITAEKSGFAKTRQNNVVLESASSRTVNLAMSLGSIEQTVSVSAAEQQVETASSDVTGSIDSKQLSQIAMNGRNYYTLLNNLPGVTTNTTDPASVGVNLTATSINGSRTPSTGVYIDGINNLSVDQNTYQLIVPSPDIISEVHLLTASYLAEYGGNAGSMIVITTKSGTKQFHGSFYEYIRNNIFDAQSYLATSAPALHRNDFGATFGGPLFIPHKFNTDKSKLFFFVSAEKQFYHFAAPTVSLVPTSLEQQGNFSQSSAKPINPATGLRYPGDVILKSDWSANGPRLLNVLPRPNYTGAGGNFIRNALTAQEPLQVEGRADYILSSKTRISGTAAYDSWYTYNDGRNLGLTPSTNGGGSQPGWILGVNATTVFSPELLNYASASLSVERFVHLAPTPTLSRAALGINYPTLSPADPYNEAPNLVFGSGYTGYGFLGDPGPSKGQGDLDLHDDVSLIRGAHNMKFGVEFLRGRDNEKSCGCGVANGRVTFNTSAKGSTGNVVADALLGNFYEYQQDLYGFFSYERFSLFDLYAQDSWQINSHLHLDFGVRWDRNGLPYSTVGNEAIFRPSLFDPSNAVSVDPKTGTITPNSGNVYNGLALLGNGPSDYPYADRIPSYGGSLNQFRSLFIGLPKGIWNTPETDFSPRIGFAYSPFSKGTTAIRGGFGMFYDRPAANIYLLNMADNPPVDSQFTIFNGNIDNPGAAAGAVYPTSLVTVGPTSFKTPSMMTFNFGVQQQLPGNIILDTGYVGTLGRHLARGVNINQLPVGTLYQPQNKGVNANALRPYRGYGTITQYQYSDSSNYNALQVSVSRRASAGVSFQSAFTYSKALDYLGQQTGYEPVLVQNAYNIRSDYGLSDLNNKFTFAINAQYTLPFARHSMSALYRAVASGWTLSPVFHISSGFPLSVTVTPDIAGVGTAGSRASLLPGADVHLAHRTASEWFNTAAFVPVAQMPLGQFGNTGRNFLIGPGISELDLAILKHFHIREKSDLEFRAESFNLPNHPSFTTLGTIVGARGFGAVNGTSNPRILQFGADLSF